MRRASASPARLAGALCCALCCAHAGALPGADAPITPSAAAGPAALGPAGPGRPDPLDPRGRWLDWRRPDGARASAGLETLTPAAVTIAGRVSYLLANGAHPFVDPDARRVILSMALRGTDPEHEILGWRDLVVEAAVTDAAEALAPTLPRTSGEFPQRAKQLEIQLGLPAGAKAYHGLARLRGQVSVVVAEGGAAVARVPLRAVPVSGIAIGGHAELTLAREVATNGSSVLLRLSRDAAFAVRDIAAEAPDGTALRAKPRRDRRNPQGVEDGSSTFAWKEPLPEDAVLVITYLPARAVRIVRFDCGPIPFGVEVPSAASASAGEPRGADEL